MAKQTIKTTMKSFDDVDKALLKLANNESYIQRKEADMNAKMQAMRETFDKETAESRQAVLALQEDIENFCTLNKNEFEKVRTRDLVHGSVGFRKTPPKVSLLNRKYNWNTVIELLERLNLVKYVRTKKEVDKDSILTDSAANEITDEKLSSVGLRIDQTEQFGIEIKWESIQD
ncbi:MAG: hypothetical protein EPO24_07675 [Bacteroidetes bacterium]|nr:MAG: hypothetical protein EPO24_07675 [Bacteroidota bacterium]